MSGKRGLSGRVGAVVIVGVRSYIRVLDGYWTRVGRDSREWRRETEGESGSEDHLHFLV